jgi:hypothetical protein
MTTGSEWVNCSKGEKLVIPVSEASGTVISFKLTGTDHTAYVAFLPQDNGEAFKFVDISSVEAILPENSAVLDADAVTALGWSKPSGLSEGGLWYRVRIGDVKAKSSSITVVVNGGTDTNWCEVTSGILSPGKTYWWMLDYAWSTEEEPDLDSLSWIAGSSIWSFATAASGASATTVKSGYYDAQGNAIESGTPIELAVGVETMFFAGADEGTATSCAIVAGSLPPGLSLYATGKANKIGRITGVPTTAGKYYALVQTTTAGGAGKTLRLDFNVMDLGTAAGSFTAALTEEGGALSEGVNRVGRITGLSISGSGAISATVKFASGKYRFSAASFDSLMVGENALEHVTAEDAYPSTYKAMLQAPVTIGEEVYTNSLEISVVSGDPVNDPKILGYVAGTAKLTLNVLDDGFVKEVTYVGELVRDNSANAAWLAAAAKFGGYYTVSLVPSGVEPADGVPCGNGYVTLTLNSAGVAQYAGLLADGTAISGSSRIVLRGDLEDPTSCSALIPIGIF